MRRIRGRGRGRSTSRRSGRKTRWDYSLFQGLVAFDVVAAAPYTWVSSWMKWPADRIRVNDDNFIEPSDETLVRSLVKVGLTNLTNDTITGWCVGLLAFDGGEYPEFYDKATFNTSALVAPPHPITQADDDWILRYPIEFSVTSGLPAFTNVEPSPLWTESRAMRKLPPGTGILAVVGAINTLSGGAPPQQFAFSIDCRLAIRTGYTR